MKRIAASAHALFWAWTLHAGVMLFVAWWLLRRGWWQTLVDGDSSGISLIIVALGLLVTLWCGRRAWLLHEQANGQSEWQQAYAVDRAAARPEAAQLLSERTHGPHETAWWFAAAAIKLGLLGTVVGFMVMSMEIARMPSLDISQVQTLLKQMTQGMAIALYTTLVGLIVNLWLGLQLLLLDRMADKVVAGILGGQE